MYICILYVYRRRAGILFATYANRTSSRHTRQGEPQHAPRFDRCESYANCAGHEISWTIGHRTYLTDASAR